MERPSWLSGGGEMGDLIRAHDWSATPIGPIESWSPSLRMMVSFMLANRFPLLLWWGPTFCSIYNDPYRPVLGAKHPWALGRPVSECWSEIWHILKPLIETPFNGGPATWMEDIELEINRHGYLEETHFTVAYSPVPDETAPRGIGGVLATVHEISEKIVGERRVAALRDLGARIGEAKTAEEVCARAVHALEAHPKDVPFALLYLLEGETARLAGTAGLTRGAAMAPALIDLADEHAAWPLGEVQRTEGWVTVDGLKERFGTAPAGPWSTPPGTAVVLPIKSTMAHELAGFFVVGLSARLKLDELYRHFLEQIAAQVATSIANARAYEVERRRAEALAEVDRAKTAFFSNVSHEFRTPLTLMLGPAEDALQDAEHPLPGPQRERLELVHRSGLRLQKLVNSLLDFSRIEAGRVQARYVPTDLAALTADLASSFRSAVEKGGLRLTVDCPAQGEPAYVDRSMWEKIVLNLVSNAFKFTFDGSIDVALRLVNGAFELTVHDTGTGISEAELSRVFDRFHRIEGAKSRTHEGSGIGLALVRELVALHGGTVHVESSPGEGTTFTVLIPAGKSHLPPDRVGAADESPASQGAEPFVEEALHWLPDAPADASPLADASRRERIVWADDNADMRDYVRRLLSGRYDVEAVADGEAALAAIRRRIPDLVISDVMMPRLDGLGLVRALRSDPQMRSIPVIMLSARAGEESRIDGLEAGADDYLYKPFSARELLARVHSRLQISRYAAQFETLLSQAPIGVYVVDGEFRIRAANPIARRTFGDVPDLIGRDYRELVYGMREKDYAERIVGIFARTLETGEPHYTPEQGGPRKGTNADVYYEWRVDRIVLPDGRYGAVCYFRDISRYVFTERALRDADQRKDEFIAMLAHELRNPLSAIGMGVELLKRSKIDDARARFAVPAITRQTKQLQRLTSDLLDMARITHGKLVMRTGPLDLFQLAHAVVADYSLRPRNATVIEVAGRETWIDADPVRVRQMLENLVDNAVKFGGRKVVVRVESRGSLARASVRDDGQGIQPELLKTLFSPFVQGEQPLDREHGGLGLGLALVERLAALLGGAVEVASDGVGKGSTFTIVLPLASRQAAPAAEQDPAQAAKRRVLVVEDEPDSRDALRMLLENDGHEVSFARSGAECLAQLESFPAEIALVDVGLPGMDGYEVARRVRKLPNGDSILLIAVTGYGGEKHRAQAFDAGFDRHITKPVSYEQIVQAFR